jgi:hypothetical protein
MPRAAWYIIAWLGVVAIAAIVIGAEGTSAVR